MRNLILISLGASLGAISRWLISSWLNPIYSTIPLGKLTVNVLGSFIIGCSTSLFLLLQQIPNEFKLFLVTGFLGSFTTFSTFSAEIGLLIQNKDYLHSMIGILLHLVCSISAFFIGIFIMNKCLKFINN